MDSTFKFPGSPGTPLLQVSPERVNQKRNSIFDESPAGSLTRHARESSVHEKVAAFNSLAFQGKQLERKANDAALKRAMLGREEAESEMRRYREDVRALRRQVEESRLREQRVGERLESVMENYGRAKETHAHTQALWEKEIRRARKESFKSQSVVVKLQEELKSARHALKSSQADFEKEKERSVNREQEAFAARYQLVGVQEELHQVQEQIRLVEQERDALRTIAQNEEIARIAAEGRIPLPTLAEDDEFASPKKARKSMDLLSITSSAASEEELENMRMLLEWERQRANRAHDRVEFLELECRMNCCISKATQICTAPTVAPTTENIHHAGRSTTVIVPAEGIFTPESPTPEELPWISSAKNSSTQAAPVFETHRSFARTPSCEPPASALITDMSLLSILDAPQSSASNEDEDDNEATIMPAPAEEPEPEDESPVKHTMIPTFHTISTTTRIPLANAPDLTPTLLPSALDPALSPTMSREEALAQIRERRGRARSLAQGTMTPRKQMVEGGGPRRDISAPAIRSGGVRGRSQARC
ncbi:hypothetical protein MBM_07007 [Drepanopeziza brunnea f. sp. 'multigermtubi' MB_m1]|uniref:PAP2 superfamily protein n=1 Tax=Marssonina brunnea f. sp. multigermtubi (strain MB_m1) TaxID=1072389 RepID=K1WPA2_MARBU|nr:uncharacterized protein MBM_07007 [Drepanopeziza brunnea f. sp. 'multigermtubi' MB_m1]EKD14796.1 hypothetical protein MBM_07007 [Drepanopeziza brunnea f. sp. 'multigermtubi' MB_m1]